MDDSDKGFLIGVGSLLLFMIIIIMFTAAVIYSYLDNQKEIEVAKINHSCQK